MPKHLHVNFLRDAEHFQRAQEFWADLCEQLIVAKDQQGEWGPWLNTEFMPGGSTMDGAPIFSLYCAKQNKGLSVTQQPIENWDKVCIYARTRLFGESSYPRPINHLVIGCELSEEAAAKAKRLIEHWIEPRTGIHTMDFFIDRVL